MIPARSEAKTGHNEREEEKTRLELSLVCYGAKGGIKIAPKVFEDHPAKIILALAGGVD